MVNTFSLFLKKHIPVKYIYTYIDIYVYIKFSVVKHVFKLATDQLDLHSSNSGILC